MSADSDQKEYSSPVGVLALNAVKELNATEDRELYSAAKCRCVIY